MTTNYHEQHVVPYDTNQSRNLVFIPRVTVAFSNRYVATNLRKKWMRKMVLNPSMRIGPYTICTRYNRSQCLFGTSLKEVPEFQRRGFGRSAGFHEEHSRAQITTCHCCKTTTQISFNVYLIMSINRVVPPPFLAAVIVVTLLRFLPKFKENAQYVARRT
jgi:hypothetical protein